jgi:acyl-CoA reductase-like NAD-dependent aldehyde dehydrogenase
MRGIRRYSSLPHVGQYINGRWMNSSETIVVDNPATGNPLCTVAKGTKADIQLAIAAGKQAFDSGVWSTASPADRFDVMMNISQGLKKQLDLMAEMESLQTGRPLREMKVQLSRVPEWIEYFASLNRTYEGSVTPFKGDMLNYIQRVPLGVVGQITPWNHPLLIALKKISPALATGNSIVVKPSELAPVNVLKFAEICCEAGLPSGILNVVCGVGSEAGEALVTSPDIAKLDITGGTETGRVVASAAGRNLVECIAELGGKAPVIVFEDCNLQDAVNGAAFAAFIASGQTCVMGSRILVHQSIHDEFVNRLVKKVSSIKIGSPMSLETQMGPLITKKQQRRVQEFVQQAVQEGCNIACGGAVPSREGFYFEPTIITNCKPSHTIFREEVFGPVVCVVPFEDEQEALTLANDSDFGLAAGVWTLNVKRAHRFAQRLDVGLVWVNGHHHNDPSSPWGGTKLSGMGRENGKVAFEAYTQPKSIVINYGSSSDWFGDNHARYG